MATSIRYAAARSTPRSQPNRRRSSVSRFRKRQKELLHGAFDPTFEEPLPGRLADGASRPRRNPAWRIAAAVGWLTIGIVAGYVLRGTKPAELSAVPPLARNAAIAHVVYVPEVRHPVEVGADQEAHLVQWLSKRLGTPLKTPRFTEQGFDLVGGRLLPGERGPVAQFMYQDANGRRLTLYVKVDADNRDTAFRYAQKQRSASSTGSTASSATRSPENLPRSELLAIAESAYRQLSP